jgi:uncharacterized RDD family membrane protein YckC
MQHRFDSQPAAPVGVAISEPPVAPVALSFDSSPATVPSPQARQVPRAPAAARLLCAWAVDLALLGSTVAANLLAATSIAGQRGWSEALAAAAWLWVALAAVLAIAWSWIFIALCGRTPGMAVAGFRVQAAQGGRPAPACALLRAVLALVFAAPGVFGFVVALFDPRGQTLHDKVSRCVTVVD